MVKGNVHPYCHMEFNGTQFNSYSIFISGYILRLRSGSTFRISRFFIITDGS